MKFWKTRTYVFDSATPVLLLQNKNHITRISVRMFIGHLSKDNLQTIVLLGKLQGYTAIFLTFGSQT